MGFSSRTGLWRATSIWQGMACVVVSGLIAGCSNSTAGSAGESSPAQTLQADLPVTATSQPVTEPSDTATTSVATDGREVRLTKVQTTRSPRWRVKSGAVFAFTVTSDVSAELVVERAGDEQKVTDRASVFPESQLVESVRLERPGAYEVVAVVDKTERRVIAHIDAV